MRILRRNLRLKMAGTMPPPSESFEIGNQAIWSVSSCKPGNGVTQLRDNSSDTYWQSDGSQPHLINIEFLKKTAVQRISLYTDYKLDESYTPSKIAVKAGTNFHDLQQISLIDIKEPEDWVNINLKNKDGRPPRAFLFQVNILANHQNGRDTHIRQVKVYEPKLHSVPSLVPQDAAKFESVEFASMLTCR